MAQQRNAYRDLPVFSTKHDHEQELRRRSSAAAYTSGATTSGATTMPTLIGAAMIAAAILLSTLISAVGTRYAGLEGPTEDNAWLVDRHTGKVYRCQAPERGQAACEADVATGSIDRRRR